MFEHVYFADVLGANFSILVQKFINEDRLPHLLFYGPPGTGKTSTILAIAKQLYTKKEFGSMVLEVWIMSKELTSQILSLGFSCR